MIHNKIRSFDSTVNSSTMLYSAQQRLNIKVWGTYYFTGNWTCYMENPLKICHWFSWYCWGKGGGDNNDVLWKMHLYEYSNRIIYVACQNEFKSDPTLKCIHMYHPTNKIEEYVDMGNLYFAKLSMS